jgi:hypothetical protein
MYKNITMIRLYYLITVVLTSIGISSADRIGDGGRIYKRFYDDWEGYGSYGDCDGW